MKHTHKIAEIDYTWMQGGNVPGGHYVISDGVRKPFITPTREFDSIPLRYSDIVVDIGAYVGTYAIRCARFPVKEVRAYEPTPRTFDILSLTHLPNLKIFNAAIVPDQRTSVNLFISRGIGVTNSVVASHQKAQMITVPAVSYIDALKDATIVKIDVEGLEYTYPIVQSSLRAILIDFHPVPGNWMKRAQEIIEMIKADGFETVIEPNFESGWTRAGSWMRPMETTGAYLPMIEGRECCGCGISLNSSQEGKALCPTCYSQWTKKHREGYCQGMISSLLSSTHEITF